MNNFSLRLPTEQRAMLQKIAKAHGMKESDVIRQAVKLLIKSERRKKAGALS